MLTSGQNVRKSNFKISSRTESLIGTNDHKAMEPGEIINSQGDGPCARRTKIGRVLSGPLRVSKDCKCKNSGCVATMNRISLEKLEDWMIRQYNHDFNETCSETTWNMSREEVKFMNIVTRSAVLKDGHYCTDLPLRQEDHVMPNNRLIAEQRL